MGRLLRRVADSRIGTVRCRLSAPTAATYFTGTEVDVHGIGVDAHVLEQPIGYLRCGGALQRFEVRLFGYGLQSGDGKQANAEYEKRYEHFDQREATLYELTHR